MLFDSTTLLLRSIIQSLEKDGETGWDDYVELGKQCLYELHQMSRASTRAYKPDSNSRIHSLPVPDRALRAIPHMKLMNAAIRHENRAAAIENGRAAIAEMNAISALHVVAPAIQPGADAGDSAVHAEKASPAGKPRTKSAPKPAAAGKGRTARAVMAGSR